MNVQKKLTNVAAQQPGSLLYKIYQSIPKPEDQLWTKQLVHLPEITFGTIYEFLVDRKVVLPKVSYLDSIANERADKVMQNDAEDDSASSSKETAGLPTESTRTLRKAYRFFHDGHIQGIKFHPMPNLKDFICVTAKVLPSMRKDRVYAVNIVICESSSSVATAYCTWHSWSVWLLQSRYWYFVLFRGLYTPRSARRRKKGLHRTFAELESTKKAGR